jgi:hypothetical protein
VRSSGKDFFGLIHPGNVDDARGPAAIGQQVKQAGDGRTVKRHFHALDGIIRALRAPIDHLVELSAQPELHRIVVVEDRVLGHPVRLDGVVVVLGGGGPEATDVGTSGQGLVVLGGLPPHLGQHLIVVGPPGRLGVVALEVLYAAPHVEGQVENPLLVVPLRP